MTDGTDDGINGDGLIKNIKQLGEEARKAFKSNFNLGEITLQLLKLDDMAFQVAKSFGTGSENARGIKLSMAEARNEVVLLGGDMKNILDIQLGVNSALGRNVVIQSDAYKDLYATTEVTGQSAKDLTGSFRDIGVSIYDMTDEMEKVVNQSRAIGVNAKMVSEQVVTNVSQLNRFNFKGGVEGLAKMAAQATSLRIDMKTTLDLADKVFDPEGAIEVAAAMQRLGVAQSDLLDPLRLMDLAQNDPTELQNQLAQMSKQFTKLNEEGNFEILPGAKRQLREIASSLNMNYDELTRMSLASADLDRKLSTIRFPDTFTDDQKKMIANLSEMKDGEYVMTIDDKELGMNEAMELLASSPEKMAKFMEDQKPVDMTELQGEQLSTQKTILSVIKSIRDRSGTALATTERGDSILKSVRDIATGFEETTNRIINNDINNSEFSNKKISDAFDGMFTSFDEGLKKVLTGEEGLVEVIGEVTTEFGKLFTTMKRRGSLMGSIFNGFLPQNEEEPNEEEPNYNGNDFIKTPGMGIQTLPQDTIFGGTGFGDFIDSLKSVKGPMGNNQNDNTQSPTEVKTTADVNLNIKIDAPNQIDTNQILLAFENQGVKEKMVESMKEAMYNNGLTSPTSSRRKLMDPYVTN